MPFVVLAVATASPPIPSAVIVIRWKKIVAARLALLPFLLGIHVHLWHWQRSADDALCLRFEPTYPQCVMHAVFCDD